MSPFEAQTISGDLAEDSGIRKMLSDEDDQEIGFINMWRGMR
mgnify:CR=1 FL=1